MNRKRFSLKPLPGYLAGVFNRRAWSISLLFLALTAVSSVFVVKLYANLKPDIEELLPTTSRSVMDLKQVTSRLRSIDNLAVLIFSEHSEDAGRFQDALARELEKLPESTSAAVEYRISDELAFFSKRKALFISKEDLLDVRNFIEDRINYEKFIYNPINLVIDHKPLEPEYDFHALEKRYASQSEEFAHFPGGVYATPDGKKRLILVYAPDQSITTAHKLKDAVEATVKRLNPQTYAPDLTVKFSGNVQDIIEEQAALLEDLLLSTVLVTILVSIVLFLYFRSLVATIALIFNLGVGTIITFGLSYFAVGYLNANSAFLGSIVMGNGINFGIMVLARYMEELRGRARPHEEALAIALRETCLPTLTAAVAGAFSYGSLMLTSFRGFSQFGIIGFIGMAACWTSAYTFFPAFLSLLNRYFSVAGKERRVEARSLWSMGLKFLLSHCAWPVAVLGVLFSIFTIYEVAHINRSIIESDLTKLRDKRSMTEGSGYLTRDIDEILKRYSSPIAVLAHNEKQAEQIAKNLKELKAKEGDHPMIASVMRVQDFIPPEQNEKIRLLHEIKEVLPPKILWRLGDEEKKRVNEFVSPETLRPFGMKDLPNKLLDRFREKNGQIGNLVLVEPPLTDDIRNGDFLLKFVKEIREQVDAVGEKIPVAGRLPVSADMLSAILKEGPIATLVSWLAVVILTILLFRNVHLSVLVLGSLLLGVIWLMALLVWFDLKINFLNFIALPITFGIGVDYAVNVFERYREERTHTEMDSSHAVIRAVYHTGGAVVLASLTTIIGWGSLLIAGNQAFVSFGKVAVIGELTCVTVAVLVIPAVLIALQGRKNRT
jgi:predicted RND superfamily exporter protein